MSEPEDPNAPRATLSSDGTLEGRLSRLEPVSPTAFAPPTDEAIELAEVAPPPVQRLPVSPVAPSRKRSPVKIVLIAFGLGLGLLVVALVRGVVSPPPPAGPDEMRETNVVESLIAPKLGRAIIMSEPAGATIVFNGQVVGTTPWAGDNRFGTKPLELKLPGYKPWKGALPDSADAKISAQLTR